jgi:hypothetical protein
VQAVWDGGGQVAEFDLAANEKRWPASNPWPNQLLLLKTMQVWLLLKGALSRLSIEKIGADIHLYIHQEIRKALKLAGDGRLERPAFGSGDQRSIHLS